ncbi:MAG: isocitrate/isopropylmalate family dehydrogenase, partial [Thermoplasmata archaeon]|nr:isocitrate/isopropylmalate family dehydrogenase [Thermoplasmata archaeon]
MTDILLLPGDGQGPEAVSAAGTVIEAATDQAGIVRGDIGFQAYERYGESLPYETLDLVGKHPVVVSGPTACVGEGDARRSPLDTLMSQLDLFARSRTFRSLADGVGAPGVEATVWGSNMNPSTDITETRDVDGVTISKYIRSAFYARMMAVALSDMELSGKTKAVCLSKADLFPQSSSMFQEAFDALFAAGGMETSHANVRQWLSDAVVNPDRYEYLVVVDLYSSIADSVFAGLTGGDALTPTKYVGDGNTLILPGGSRTDPSVPGDMSACSAVASAAQALAEVGLRDESEAVLGAMRSAIAAGERSSDLGG